VQGRGVLQAIGTHVADLGKDALVVADANVWGLVGKKLDRSFRAPRSASSRKSSAASARTGRSTGS
jgi:glycerol dehydrogenase-like iron-containing ADH family enzyme